MAMSPKEMAEIVRRLSMKTAPKDVVLAAITQKEEAILKARGGSGKVDPVTGVKHFYDLDDDGPSGSNTTNNASDPDKDKETGFNGRSGVTTGFGKMPGDSGAWTNNTGGAYGDLSGTQTTKRDGKYNAETGEYKSSSVTMSGWDRIRSIAAGLFGSVKSIGPLLSGNPVGLAYGAVTGTKAATNFINGIRGNTGLPGDDPGPVTTSDSNARSGAGLAAAKALTDTSAGLLGTFKSRTPTIDYFTAIARSKQGAKSTVLGGGTGVSPTSTSLLGV